MTYSKHNPPRLPTFVYCCHVFVCPMFLVLTLLQFSCSHSGSRMLICRMICVYSYVPCSLQLCFLCTTLCSTFYNILSVYHALTYLRGSPRLTSCCHVPMFSCLVSHVFMPCSMHAYKPPKLTARLFLFFLFPLFALFQMPFSIKANKVDPVRPSLFKTKCLVAITPAFLSLTVLTVLVTQVSMEAKELLTVQGNHLGQCFETSWLFCLSQKGMLLTVQGHCFRHHHPLAFCFFLSYLPPP